MSKESAALRKRKRALLNKMTKLSGFIRGSVVILKRPCTYEGCKVCKSGKKHSGIYHSISKKGKTHITYLGRRREAFCREKVEEHNRLKDLIEEISDINLRLLVLDEKDAGEKTKKRSPKR